MTDLEGAVERVVLEAAERMHADLGSDLSWPEEIPPSRDWLIGLARLALEPILPRDTMGIGSREFYVLESASWSRIAKAQQERATKAEAERDAMREAGKPFFDLAKTVTTPAPGSPPWWQESQDWTVVFSFAGCAVTLGDLRRAAALVNGEVG